MTWFGDSSVGGNNGQPGISRVHHSCAAHMGGSKSSFWSVAPESPSLPFVADFVCHSERSEESPHCLSPGGAVGVNTAWNILLHMKLCIRFFTPALRGLAARFSRTQKSQQNRVSSTQPLIQLKSRQIAFSFSLCQSGRIKEVVFSAFARHGNCRCLLISQ